MADRVYARDRTKFEIQHLEADGFFLCPNYAQNLLSGLGALWKEGAFCDVQINVMEKSFQTHRAVLSAVSPYFRVMFLGGLAESAKTVIDIHAVDPPTFEQILRYFYSGEIAVSEDNVESLLPAAKMFQLEDVEKACCKYLKNQLDPSNCIGINQFAQDHACEELAKISEAYLNRHFVVSRKAEEFLELELPRLLKILESEDLKVDSEDDVFLAALDWILHDIENRQMHLSDLFEHVRLPLVSKRAFEDAIQQCKESKLHSSLQEHHQRFLQIPSRNSVTHYEDKSLRYLPRRAAKKCLYYPGGFNREADGRWSDATCLATVERYDSFSKTCSFQVAQLGFPRSGHGVAVLDGLMYCMGGENDSLIYDSTECYDPVSNTWTMVAPMTVPRVGLGACTIEDYIYAVGGWVGDQIGDTVERYNREEDKWEVVGPVQTRRFQAGVVEMKGFLFAVGGIGESGEELRSVEMFNPVTEWWTSLKNLKQKRAFVGLAAHDGWIYACGGHNEANGTLDTVEAYNPDLNLWHGLKPMLRARAGVAVAAYDGLVYVLGGRTGGTHFSAPVTLNSIDCYDPRANSWTEVSNMNFCRAEGGVAVI